ncbi:MAG: hypothetical protein WC319_01985 [Candidatus Paceibacterota bacterium]|jgi:hypothetical protein
MKMLENVNQVLRETDGGNLTIATDLTQLNKLRRQKFEIFSGVQKTNSLKGKRGVPIVFITAKDVKSYMSLIMAVENYKVLNSDGQLLSPMSTAA